MVYTYLLTKVGVESKVVTSVELNHAWNMIKLDGNWYQVDLTWDDPRTNINNIKHDVISRVNHSYFLKSRYAFNHGATDWIDLNGSVMSQVTATNYNNYFWSDSSTAIPCYNGKWYYISPVSGTYADLNAYSFSTNTSVKVMDFNAVWSTNSGYYTTKYTGLSMVNNFLIYNNMSYIYALDVSGVGSGNYTPLPMTVYTKIASDSADGSFYGCVADGTQVTYELRTDMNDSTPVRKTINITLPTSANVTISGTVKSASSDLVSSTASTAIELYRAGTNTVVYRTSVSGSGTKTYSIPNVAAGSYTIGYGAQTPFTVTVTNTGTVPTGDLTVSVLGTNFTTNKATIISPAANATDTFTVVLVTGLAVGKYTATVTVSGGAAITPRSFNVRFTVLSETTNITSANASSLSITELT